MRQDAGSPASSSNRQGSSGGNGGGSQNGSGTSAFMTLAGYIFGKNDRQEKMAMTMPVFSDSSGRMQFFMGNNMVMHRHISACYVLSCSAAIALFSAPAVE